MSTGLLGLKGFFCRVFMPQSNGVLFCGWNVVGISCPNMAETTISWSLEASSFICIHYWVGTMFLAVFRFLFVAILYNILNIFSRFPIIIWRSDCYRQRKPLKIAICWQLYPHRHGSTSTVSHWYHKNPQLPSPFIMDVITRRQRMILVVLTILGYDWVAMCFVGKIHLPLRPIRRKILALPIYIGMSCTNIRRIMKKWSWPCNHFWHVLLYKIQSFSWRPILEKQTYWSIGCVPFMRGDKKRRLSMWSSCPWIRNAHALHQELQLTSYFHPEMYQHVPSSTENNRYGSAQYGIVVMSKIIAAHLISDLGYNLSFLMLMLYGIRIHSTMLHFYFFHVLL